MKRSMMALATSLFAFGIANPALSATIFSETTNNNDQTSTAQVIGSVADGDIISGNLTGDALNADLFQINLTAGTAFTATVNKPTFDTQLFLFDASGKGITGNDNVADSSGGITDLNAIFTYTPTITGTYYLAISGFDFDPQDSTGNFLFSNNSTGNFTPVSNAALFSWAENTITDFGLDAGSYQITLNFSAVSAVPEPSVLPGLIGLAGGLGLTIFKRKRLA
jgi:Bacterial pre-peptidase C-terminal domain